MSAQWIPSKGDPVKQNWWTDRRDSGWKHGVVISDPVSVFGEISVYVKWHNYESLSNVRYLEPDDSRKTNRT